MMSSSASNPRLQLRARAALELRRRREAGEIAVGPARWVPNPGPQAAAFACTADQIGYGGAAGSGKTHLALGLAGSGPHRRSIIFRRTFPNARGIIEASRELYAGRFNEQAHIWRLADGRTIEIGALQYEEDKRNHQGQARDLHVFDEATEFSESQVRFVIGWNRSTDPAVRCQVLLTFNPPLNEAGEWVIRFFAPWLQDGHPDPAADGEIRYVAMVDGAERFYHRAEDVPAGCQWKTRTFFHASLSDNPALVAAGYGATIDALPEPLRSLLKGNFAAARQADPWQVIPRAWVDAAQARWRPEPPGPLSCLGVDVARGGDDETALCPRHGAWHGQIATYPGRLTPDGPSVAALIAQQRPGDATVCVDVIGVGGSAYDHASPICNAVPVNVSERSGDTDRSGMLRFANLRSAMWWQLRESLDPAHGGGLALPPDEALRAELCAPRFVVRAGGVIQVESKDDLRKRLGRSTNRADALLLSRADAGGWGLA